MLRDGRRRRARIDFREMPPPHFQHAPAALPLSPAAYNRFLPLPCLILRFHCPGDTFSARFYQQSSNTSALPLMTLFHIGLHIFFGH